MWKSIFLLGSTLLTIHPLIYLTFKIDKYLLEWITLFFFNVVSIGYHFLLEFEYIYELEQWENILILQIIYVCILYDLKKYKETLWILNFMANIYIYHTMSYVKGMIIFCISICTNMGIVSFLTRNHKKEPNIFIGAITLMSITRSIVTFFMIEFYPDHYWWIHGTLHILIYFCMISLMYEKQKEPIKKQNDWHTIYSV
jgi:hypothetical protein